MAALLIGIAVVSLVLIVAMSVKKVGRNAPSDRRGDGGAHAGHTGDDGDRGADGGSGGDGGGDGD